jgi:hypothetical protein
VTPFRSKRFEKGGTELAASHTLENQAEIKVLLYVFAQTCCELESPWFLTDVKSGENEDFAVKSPK